MNQVSLIELILDEYQQSPYVSHPGYQKMLTTIRKYYFWPRMHKDIIGYLTKCLKFQKFTVEHEHPASLLDPIPIPEWKWEDISHEFITGTTTDW